MKPADYQAFTEQLTNNLATDKDVVGLVLLGSTAGTERQPDQWSDHDFFVITRSGEQERFRTTFDWLPDHNTIVLTVRETAHGLKVLYESGHILEYAAFDLEEIALARANAYSVTLDRGGVAEAMTKIASDNNPAHTSETDLLREMGLFLCLLVIGTGRVARGESISGGVFIRTYALSHLLSVLAQVRDSSDVALLDNLDPFRRFEHVFPDAGAQINAALALPPINTALALLDLFERELSQIKGFPVTAAKTVRRMLEGHVPA